MKPNAKVIKAIRAYYHNRSIQAIQKWDKELDLKNISKAVLSQFHVYEACAGTFWLKWQTPTGKWRCIKTNEDNFPNFVKEK